MRIFRSSTYRQTPWKNGGGVTTEIIVFPEGAALSDFDWRVSMAQVSSDGAFSEFEGIDRTLTVIEGAAMTLHFGEQRKVRLSPVSPPFDFPGDVPVDAVLEGEVLTDLNVMTRRGRWSHDVTKIGGDERHAVRTNANCVVLFCSGGAVTVEVTGHNAALLEKHDAVLYDAKGGELELVCHGSGDALLIELYKQSA